MRILIAFLLLFSLPARAEEAPPPLRADAGLAVAESQLAQEKYMQALQTLGGVLKRRPEDADALTYIAYAWMSIGETAKAEEYLGRALKRDPRHLGANKYKADLLLEAGEFQRALEQLQVLRLICANTDCAEINALQAELNRHKKGKKDKPAQ